MASTRNRNTPGNYCQEQRSYFHNLQYTTYANSQYGAAYSTEMPGNGLLPAQIPANKLSYNACDIESYLFGINSTNLVNPATPCKPEIKINKTNDLFIKPKVAMPAPLLLERNQRPFPV